MNAPTSYTLYSLGIDVLEAIELSGGEVTEEVALLLDHWDKQAPERGEKLDALRYVTKQLEAQADFLSKEAKALTLRKRGIENQIRNIKERATSLLLVESEISGESKIKTGSHSYWIVATSKVVGPENVSDWPEALRRVRLEPDKTAAKKILEDGGEIPGVSLIETPSIRWR